MDLNILRFAAALGVENDPDRVDLIGVCTIEGIDGPVYTYDRDGRDGGPGDGSESVDQADLILWAPTEALAHYPDRLPNNVGLPDYDFDADSWFEYRCVTHLLNGGIGALYRRVYSPMYPRQEGINDALRVAFCTSETGLVVDLAVEWRGTAAEFLANNPDGRAAVDSLHLGRRVVSVSGGASGNAYLIRCN